jgi:hypothetical protein
MAVSCGAASVLLSPIAGLNKQAPQFARTLPRLNVRLPPTSHLPSYNFSIHGSSFDTLTTSMPPNKTRYSSSLSTAWVIPPVSRPSSGDEPDHTQSDVNGTPKDPETARSSTSASRSKYTSTIPSNWIISSPLKEQPDESKDHVTKSSNGKKQLPLRVPLGVPDRDVLASSESPPAPVEPRFPQNRGHHESEPKTALRDHRVEYTQNDRGKAGNGTTTAPALPLRHSTVSPGAQTALSSTSASGSCDLPAQFPQVSPTYSVV